MLVFPHGIHVDRDGNVWVTDGQDNAPAQPGASTTSAAERRGPAPGATKGHQVFKFSPEGKLLMTLGKPGGAAEPDYFYQPNDVVTAPNGDIFVAEGHGGANSRILKFTKDGRFTDTSSAKREPGRENSINHMPSPSTRRDAFSSAIAATTVSRSSISRESSSTSGSSSAARAGSTSTRTTRSTSRIPSQARSATVAVVPEKRGIRVGRISDGKVIAFIPDPVEVATNTSAAEGVAADADGNIYGAEVGPKALKKYVKK